MRLIGNETYFGILGTALFLIAWCFDTHLIVRLVLLGTGFGLLVVCLAHYLWPKRNHREGNSFDEAENWLEEKIRELEVISDDGKKPFKLANLEQEMGRYVPLLKEWHESLLRGLRQRFKGDAIKDFLESNNSEWGEILTSQGQRQISNYLQKLKKTFTSDKLSPS